MISAFLDESGIHHGAEICIIAGYFGGLGQWKKFEILWRKALDRAEVPLDKFHALDLVERHGFFSFSKFATEKHARLITDLTIAITAHKIHPVTVGVIVKDFAALSEPQRRFFTGGNLTRNMRESQSRLTSSGCPSKPYFMPFLRCIGKVAHYAPVGGLAHFNFGLDRPFAKYAMEMFKMFKECEIPPDKPHLMRVGNLSFPEARKTPQLQAADFLSYLTYKHMLERQALGDLGRVGPSGILGRILERRHETEDFIFFNGAHMKNILESTYQRHGNWDQH